MAIKRFSSTFKTRNDVMDNITPNNVVQPHIAVPAGEWKPARYLPVQWTGEASKDAFVISSGKVVCLDTTGRVSDMNLKAACNDAIATTTTIITYDSTDVAYGVYNIATGEPAAALDAPDLATVAQGLLDQGLVVIGRDVTAADFANLTSFNVGNLGDCKAITNAFWSDPVGVAAYDVYVWAGDTPDELVFTNYQKQHLIQFLTEVQLRLPVVAEDSASASTFILNGNSGAYSSGSISENTQGTVLTNAQLIALQRYSGLGSDIQGFILDPAGISRNNERTPFSDANSLLVNEKSAPALMVKEGDFYIDAEAGVILMWDADADWTGSTTGKAAADFAAAVSYFTKVGAAQQYRHAHMIGPCRPGSKLSYDAQSNMCVMASAEDALGTSNAVSLGRVMEIIREPKGLLDRVETAFKGSSFSASAKMPGTATKGFSDMITLSSEVVADEIATLIVRF